LFGEEANFVALSYHLAMPIHDWTHVNAGTFHAFHTSWIAKFQEILNNGVLPAGYYAMAEQVAGNTIPDVLTLQGGADPSTDDLEPSDVNGEAGGVAVAVAPPRTKVHDRLSEERVLTARQRRIVIRHTTGDRVVALLEIVSPGNKGSQNAVDQFVRRTGTALNAGFQLLLLDLFPAGRFDPNGIHGALWGRMGRNYDQPAANPLTLAAYATAGRGLCEC
jgi:hypothetical protein